MEKEDAIRTLNQRVNKAYHDLWPEPISRLANVGHGSPDAQRKVFLDYAKMVYKAVYASYDGVQWPSGCDRITDPEELVELLYSDLYRFVAHGQASEGRVKVHAEELRFWTLTALEHVGKSRS